MIDSIWTKRTWARCTSVIVGLALTCLVQADDKGFTGGVTPSRFEISTDQGDLVRKSLKIYNLSARPQQFNVRTVEWQYTEQGQISFHDQLAPSSCREWVRLERHKISVVPDPQQPRNFRFEVQVPEDAPRQQCRFAIMIESVDGKVDKSFADGAVRLPITGRIAVIVYVNVGDPEADLEFGSLAVREIRTRRLPSIEVRNLGDAHGRLDADLVAEDEGGNKVRLSIETSPILPQQTRYMVLSPEAGKQLHYPLTVKGKIYRDDDTYEVEQLLESNKPQFIARD